MASPAFVKSVLPYLPARSLMMIAYIMAIAMKRLLSYKNNVNPHISYLIDYLIGFSLIDILVLWSRPDRLPV